ncbi:MAG: hypothetical protein ACLS3B_03920 [Veillonella atypica]|uniref:hypothetical protein n=1 Tax=Veillonella atypica TaxID=39777 RepID=UPI0039919648
MTSLEAIVLTYLNQVQRTHVDNISHNTNIQLEVLQEILNGLIRLSYIEQEHKLDDSSMPQDFTYVFFIPSGFYSITSRGMLALAEYKLTQKEKRNEFIFNVAKWLIPLIITIITSVVGWLFFTK